MSPLNRKLLRDLRATAGPALTIAVVLGIGIAGLVAFLGLWRDLRSSRSRYYEEYRYADVHLSLRRAPRSVLEDLRLLPGVDAVEGRLSDRVSIEIPGQSRRLGGRLISLPEHGRPLVNRLLLLRGRLPAPGSREVVVIEDLALAYGLSPGSLLRIVAEQSVHEVMVSGVAMSPEYVFVIPEDGGYIPDPRNFGVLWCRQRFAEHILDREGSFDDLVATVGRGSSGAALAAQLEAKLTRYGVLLARDRSDMPAWMLLDNEIRLCLIRATTVPAIFLVASALVLNLVLTRLIVTQRVQVGTLKALGVPDATIVFHYVCFALAICLLGAMIGCWLGIELGEELTRLYKRFYHLPMLRPPLHPDIALGGFLCSVLAGLAGIARAISRLLAMTPAEAMRPSPPETRSMGLVLRLRFLPLLWRMALRYLARHPYRTVVSCMGISVGVSIMMTAQFFLEGIAQVNHFRFQVCQRQDLELTLAEGCSESTRFEVMALPGVERAEAIFQHPFEIRHDRASRRVSVEGLAPDAWLQRRRWTDGRIVELPSDGILVDETLAEILGAKLGDEVELESLRGARRTHRTTIRGTFPSFVGLNAAADISWLRGLVGERHAVTSLAVLAPSRQEELEVELTRRPGILRSTHRIDKIRAFEESIRGPLDVAGRILTFLAGAIAFGMMLNGVLVSMAERQSELAVLRVQGFRRGEIGAMLLYEHVLTGFLGMIAGIPLGHLLILWVYSHLRTEILRTPFVVSATNMATALLWALVFMLLAHVCSRQVLARQDWRAHLAVKE